MKYDFITIGDAFEDIFVLPTELKVKSDHSFASGVGVSFELGEKIPLSDIDYEIGGTACNASVGFSHLGIRSSLVSMVGDDSSARKILERLKLEKVDTSSVTINKKMKSNFSVIFRFDQGRTIFIYRGLKDYSLLNIKNNIKSEWIFLGPIGGHSEKLESDIVARVAESGAKLTWNPGAIQIKNGANKYLALLKNTAVLIMNREEGIKFLNNPVRPNEEEIMRRLSLLGPKLVVITNGNHGAKAFDGKKYYFVSALPNIPRVDSTGAGDSFAVGVLAKLFIEKWNYEENTELIAEALKWGIVNSNSVIQHIGAQKGLLTLTQIERETAKNQRLKVEIQDGNCEPKNLPRRHPELVSGSKKL